MNILTTYRGLSPNAIQSRGIDQLLMDRIAIGEARDESMATMERLRQIAVNTGKALRSTQAADFDAAEATCREAGPLFHRVDTLIRELEDEALAEVGGQRGSRSRSFGGDPESYTEGRPLTRSQTFTGYVRSRGLVRDYDGGERLDLGKYLRGLATGNWRGAEAEQRAMSEGVQASGGYMVPVQLLGEVIDLARAKARVFEAGARLVPMETKDVSVAKWDGDPTAAWHSENAVIAPSDATLGTVQLKAKALTSLTRASRELLEDAENVDVELKEAFAAQFALTLDKAGLYGSGTDPEPRGVKNTTGVTTVALATNGRTPTWDDLVDAGGALSDVNESATGFLYAPRTDRALAKAKTSDGQYVAPPTILDGTPRLPTNQVPIDLTEGTSNVASDIFTGDWGKLLIGIRTSMQITVLTERYADTGELGFLSWFRGDVAVARGAAFHVQTGALA